MATLNDRICKHCQWWNDLSSRTTTPVTVPRKIWEGGEKLNEEEKVILGQCHRHSQSFPGRREDDWCGEFDRKWISLEEKDTNGPT